MKTASKYKVILISAAALLILGLGIFAIFHKEQEAVHDPHEGQVYINDGFGMVWMTPLEGVPVNPLHPSDFKILNNQPSFTSDGYTVTRGIDVSEHQHEIDWSLASRKIDYAYIRLGYRGYTEGGVFEDPYFVPNIKGAKENGLQTGVYFFSQAISVEEAVEEAEFVIKKLKNFDVDLPVVFDWEKIEGGARTDVVTPELLNECALAFCSKIEEAGYEAAVYFNRYIGYYMYDLSKLTDYEFWLAVPGDHPDFYYATQMWQYTFDAKIPGISTPTDMNLRLIPDVPLEIPEKPQEEKKENKRDTQDEYADLPIVEFKNNT